MKKIELFQLTKNELVELVKISATEHFKTLLKEFQSKESQDELLTRKETCKLLNVDQATLYRWCKRGKVKGYNLGGRKYFKRQEIMNSLKEDK